MVLVQNLSVEFSAKPLFSGVSFTVNASDKIALTGKNGAGKSTLLKIIAGLQQPTSGNIALQGDVVVGYLPQQMKVADDTTVKEEVKKVFGKTARRQAELDRINGQLASRTDYESDEYAALIERSSYLIDRLAIEGSDNVDAEIERTLVGLGFSRSDLARPTSEFSGGWRMRIELAKILLQRPDLLLLDEPTNHLDIESIQWLEEFIRQRAKAVVLVSHDRAFMDNVTNRTIEISCGRIYDYKANYTHYVELRQERMEQQRRAYENQQKEIADIKDFIERFRYKPTKSNQVQSRIKQLEKIVPIEIDEVDRSHLSLKFPPAPRSGDFPLIAEGVGKSFGSHKVFADATFTLRRGEKVAFVGKNGEGKSTLVKCIMGQLDHDGVLKLGHNVKIGYFAQNQAQLLDGDITVFDTIDRVAVGDIRTRIRDILGAFMFGGEASDKKVSVLSGGEKTRLAMIRLLLEPVNFLILDEPTNHLDLSSKDVLKEAIRNFDGTVILVSHDREFLDGLVEKVYEFGGGRVVENLGGIYDFLQRKRIASLGELERTGVQPSAQKNQSADTKTAAKKTTNPETSAEKTSDKPSRKLSYAEQRERDKMLRRATKEVQSAEARIAQLEEEQKNVEQLIAGGDTSEATLQAYEKASKELENAMSLWELAQIELDELKERLNQ